ncbi:MAG: sugar phosphate nucleotidyltransferase [Steroidobacter sp.]
MANGQHVWGLVLAGGDGSRLRALTTSPCGAVAPKQFCSLCGGQSLLEDAVDRAEQFTDQQRICTIVAQQHRQWWTGIERLNQLPAGNVIVQPRNRGTAIGVLYSLLHIVAKDSNARIVLLPADHYVRDEGALRESLHTALAHVEWDAERPVLLGLEPDETDLELGYILPGPPDPLEARSVSRFIEKPGLADALDIIDAGGLWNTFIVAASAQSLINLFLPRYAPLVMEMQVILSRGFAAGSPTAAWPAINDLYERLPYLDFSRDLLQGRESKLCVLPVPPCGWSDLGTPRRVGETLRRLRPREQAANRHWQADYVNLAAQYARTEAVRG